MNAKTHKSTKGRIDGMKKLFAENDIKLGDCIEAYYYKDKNRVVLVKNKYLDVEDKMDNDILYCLRRTC